MKIKSKVDVKEVNKINTRYLIELSEDEIIALRDLLKAVKPDWYLTSDTENILNKLDGFLEK